MHGRAAAGSSTAEMILTAQLYGPYRAVGELRNEYPPDSRQVAVAPIVRWSTGTGSAGSAVSVVTIPADAGPGYYDLQFGAAARSIGGSPGWYNSAILAVR